MKTEIVFDMGGGLYKIYHKHPQDSMLLPNKTFGDKYTRSLTEKEKNCGTLDPELKLFSRFVLVLGFNRIDPKGFKEPMKEELTQTQMLDNVLESDGQNYEFLSKKSGGYIGRKIERHIGDFSDVYSKDVILE